MERPERPSRPEKPNRSQRIRRTISSLLQDLGSQGSTDSDPEDVVSFPSSSRRPTSRRHCPFGAGASSSNAQDASSSSLLSQESSGVQRNYHDVYRSEPSSSLVYTFQEETVKTEVEYMELVKFKIEEPSAFEEIEEFEPFRSPQRPSLVPAHPCPVWHHPQPQPQPASHQSSTFNPVSTNTSRNRDFNILMQSTVGTLRDTSTGDRDRSSLGASFYLCDENPHAPKRFCSNPFSNPRQLSSFAISAQAYRDRNEASGSSSGTGGGWVAGGSMMNRDVDRRFPNIDGLTNMITQASERNNAGFVGPTNSSTDNDAMTLNADGTLNASGINDSPASPTETIAFSMPASSNRASLTRSLSRTSSILRAVDELEEVHMRRRELLDDLDEVLPSSRPVSDSEDRDEDIADTHLDFLQSDREAGGTNLLSQPTEPDRIDAHADATEQEERQSPESPPPAMGMEEPPPPFYEELEPVEDGEDVEEDEDEEAGRGGGWRERRIEEEETDPEVGDEVVFIPVNRVPMGNASANVEDAELSDMNSTSTEEDTFHLTVDDRLSRSSANGNDSSATKQPAATQNNNFLDGQDFNSKILALLECPVCLETIVPPIKQCKKGHPVCGTCRPRLNVCPTCRCRFTGTRNLLMEKIADFMLFPCKNYLVGCMMNTLLKDKATHEIGCGHRQYECVDPDCNWKGYKQELLVHCNLLHKENIIISTPHEYQTINIPFEPARQTSWVMSAMDEVFIVTFKVFQYSILRGTTVFLGTQENAMNFNYYFKFGGKKRKSFKYREMTTAHKSSIYAYDFFQETCFSYQFDPLAFKMLNAKPIVECKVAVTQVCRHN